MKYQLFRHQEVVKSSLRNELKKHKKVLLMAHTGFGKTILSKNIIDSLISKGYSVLFTVPRIKLAIQTKEKFGYGNLILGNKTENNNSLCTIASLQSLYERKITNKFDYIFIDECHFAEGSKYQNYIFENYNHSTIIGLSATPIDQNGYLLQGYDSLVNAISMKYMIDNGYLTDVDVYTSKVQPDLSDVKIINGDYNNKEATEVLKENKILTNTVDEWVRLGSDLKTIVFASSIDHSEELKAEFIKRGYTANTVHSKMKENEIENVYSDFRHDKIQLLINVDMATFGFDEPSLRCMLFARAIKSLRLYKQMVGRGIRKFPNKETCLMIDCANVVADNGYPTDEIPIIKRPVVSKRIDNILKLERDVKGEVVNQSVERIEYLSKISSLVDLYADKIYSKEQDLVDDCKKILKRAGYYIWRQNSGKANINGRWVHFTDKNGIPDITLIYKSIYIGLELKLPKGRLTRYQKLTLPEFKAEKIHFFIIENVIDLFESLENIKENIIDTEKGVLIKNELFDLSEQQKKYHVKYKVY
jgi:superfamily II DNA or RNA helicase